MAIPNWPDVKGPSYPVSKISQFDNIVLSYDKPGAEQRLAKFDEAIYQFKLRWNKLSTADADKILSFFNARKANLEGFFWQNTDEASNRDRIWQANKAYEVGDIVIPSTPNGHSYICTSAGTSGNASPAFSTIVNASFLDGTCTFRENSYYVRFVVDYQSFEHFEFKLYQLGEVDLMEISDEGIGVQGYKKLLPLTGHSGTGAGYQKLIHVVAGEGMDASGIVYLNNHSVAFPDFHFEDASGNVLPMGIEEAASSPTDKWVWVRVAPTLDTNQNIYIKYGAGESSVSDLGAVFDFFDDFKGTWTRQGTCLGPSTAAQEPTVLYMSGAQMISPNPDGKIFRMWYTSGWGSSSTSYAESNTGLPGSWTVYGVVVAGKFRNNVWWNPYDGLLYMICTQGSSFYMYHSSDGIHWTSDGVVMVTGPGTYDNLYINNSFVVVEGPTSLKMLYEGTGTGGATTYATCLATSADGGHTWTKLGVVLADGKTCTIDFAKKIGDTYYGWAHRSTDPRLLVPTDIFRYRSSDMQTWTRDTDTPNFGRTTSDEGPSYAGGSDNDQGQVADPYLVEALGKTFLFYDAMPDQYGSDVTIKVATFDGTIAQLVATNEDALDLTKWNLGGQFEPGTYVKGGEGAMSIGGTGSAPLPRVFTKSYQITDGIIEFKLKQHSGGWVWLRHNGNTDTTTAPYYAGYQGAMLYIRPDAWKYGLVSDNVNPIATDSDHPASDDTYYYYRAFLNGHVLTVKRYTDPLFSQNEVVLTGTDTGGLTSGYIGWAPNDSRQNATLDFIRTRKYNFSGEPAWGVPGPEQAL